MTDIQNLSLFIALSLVLIVVPGPDMIFVLTKGISSGKRAGLISAVGVTLGILVHTIFAALGLSIILKTSALAFTLVKVVGTGYMIYLGVKTLLSKTELKLTQENKTSDQKIFFQGLITNILNPKVALFFMAFLPQFINTESGNGTTFLPFAILGITFALFTLLWLVALGFFSGMAGHYLQTRKSISRWINAISGSILVLLGMRLAFINQNE